MVHPPLDATWIAALPDVLYRHQLAAACVLAQLGGGWFRTREVYEDLIFGPVDWTSAAAIASLGELARRSPDDAREARSVLLRAVGDLIPHSSETRFWPLLHALGTLPGVPEEAMETLSAWYRAHLAEAPPQQDREPMAQPAKPSPTASSAVPWRLVLLVMLGACAAAGFLLR